MKCSRPLTERQNFSRTKRRATHSLLYLAEVTLTILHMLLAAQLALLSLLQQKFMLETQVTQELSWLANLKQLAANSDRCQ